ncbi:hypothetical protein ACTHPH_24435, partial [Paenibacillus pasadenensis]
MDKIAPVSAGPVTLKDTVSARDGFAAGLAAAEPPPGLAPEGGGAVLAGAADGDAPAAGGAAGEAAGRGDVAALPAGAGGEAPPLPPAAGVADGCAVPVPPPVGGSAAPGTPPLRRRDVRRARSRRGERGAAPDA